ncbi:MAG TPA: response regulator transcription factor [Usitatibacter sp.]|nr:response regulator transcription factor [Usitatibacter sp.]
MKILIIDDHELVREGLRPVLAQLGAPGEDVMVLQAGSYTRGVEIAAQNQDLDLVLLDFNLPNVQGFAALVDIQERFPDIPVVMVSGQEDPDLVRGALERGALGFIPKNSTSAVIVSALRLVLSGGTYIPREAMAASRTSARATLPARDGANAAARLGITPRQAEVLALMLAGKPNKAICRELNLAEGTVKSHVAAVLKALDASNRVEAVIAAAKLGLKA